MKRWLFALPFLLLGCGAKVPQFPAEEQDLLKRFEKEIAGHKVPALKQLCDRVDKLHDEQKLTDEQYQALHKVCGPAVEGQWDRADALIKSLIAGQQKK